VELDNHNNEDRIYAFLRQSCEQQKEQHNEITGLTTQQVAEGTQIQRANVSSKLNKLYRDGRIIKRKGKPVVYQIDLSQVNEKRALPKASNLDMLIGSEGSLKGSIQQAKAAILYPPAGLHSLILGPTGVGKTMFAELMYKFAYENGVIDTNAPFIAFNCADYSNNSQLLLSHLFGTKKGAFTGATEDRSGIVDKADGGILFLDEVHRLPSAGQEMLFYLIDRGQYSPLGAVGEKKEANVLIICATTEDKDSALLGTFLRRIPMVINLPSLRNRNYEERFKLIRDFFRLESKRIGKEIVVTSDVVKNLLLYNCSGNIGQLKSDIQLGCANAFLRCISGGEKKIKIFLPDFPKNIREGILHYKHNRESIDKIIPREAKLSFKAKEPEVIIDNGDYNLPDNFYEVIESRIHELQSRGIDEQDINLIMSFDVDNYFKKYINRFDKRINKRELSKIVNKSTIELVEQYLNFASEKLNRVFSSKVFYGLCLHLNASIERIRKNVQIVNHNFNEIVENYPEEYAIAYHFSGIIEKEMKIRIPVEEVGFMAMFLSVDQMEEERNGIKPVVIIAMHGNSAATSISEVVNRIVGAENTFAYDLSLDINTKTAYAELSEVIRRNHRGGGVLLLVDMGSLGMMAELISEELGIKIRVIDMVTTVTAMECSRKALTESNIDIIWDEIASKTPQLIQHDSSVFKEYKTKKDNIIITLCITGEGSALKLKHMIEENIDLEDRNVHVVPLSISNQENIHQKVNKLSKEKNIIAIVGTIDPGIHGISYIPVSELFLDGHYQGLKALVYGLDKTLDIHQPPAVDEFYDQFFMAINKEIEGIDIIAFSPYFKQFVNGISKELKCGFDMDVISGLIFHMSSAMEKIVAGIPGPICNRKDHIMQTYSNSFEVVRDHLRSIEEQYQVTIPDDEVCFLLSIIHCI